MIRSNDSLDINSGFNGDVIDSKDVPWWTSCRLRLAILGFFGFVNLYALRVNLSVAIVCMVNGTAVHLKSETPPVETNSSVSWNQHFDSSCGRISSDNDTSVTRKFQDGNIVWEKTTQGLILGSFFWGYLATQIPGGWVAAKFGGKRVLGLGMAICSLCTFVTPIAAQTNYIFLLVVRVLMGIASGAVFPAMHTMWGKWAPPLERSKLTAFTYAGSQAGIVLTFPISSLLCKYGFAGGWPSIFYTLGLVSIIWVVLWMLLTSDSPEQHKGISTIEKQYILQSLRKTTRQGNTMDLNVPWRSIFTSMPVYAIVLSNFASDWGGYTFLTNIPSYMKEVLKLDITSNGFYSALPYIGFWCVVNGAGVLADFTQKYLTTTMTRKIFEFSGKVMPALLLIGLGYLDCTMKSLAIALLTLGVSFSAFQYSGFLINHMDIAPAYAGILFGISNSCGAISGFISPAAVGLITEKHQSRSEWQKVFFIAAAVYLFSAFFYLIFGKGEPQNWAVEDTTLEMEELNTKIEKRDNYEE
ncbi:sialin-like isoform X1 [Ostrea edulis]|uniref:sialin-like isoform X1 n=1 Tax=Ostrea edulis TaxID=37623 RepID=UPI0024AF305A|nr:sialin-like isoform X1 [Ostrea edulis]